MLKYLLVQLDDTSPSFCHYSNNKTERKLIAYVALQKGIVWAMKENLMIQFVYPAYKLPKEYLELIDSVDHIDIKPANEDSDVTVFEGKASLLNLKENIYHHVVLRLSKNELFDSIDDIQAVLNVQSSLNIVMTDIELFNEEDYVSYKRVLEKLSTMVIEKMREARPININLLTDRLLLSTMNNCNAGNESITLAPDGNFYICPAFYFDGEENIGSPVMGVSIPNGQLYKLQNAPICRSCDAYQCKRCVWLNQKTTLEVNTPSHEQCVVSHLERNVSRILLDHIKELRLIKTEKSIPEIDYLDPFDKIAR